MSHQSLQQLYEPTGRCFGCGPANEKGLRIASFPLAEGSAELVCEWQPEDHHEAFENVLNGGIIGALLDCHSNWTACWFLMQRDGLEKPPTTVTADFHVFLKRPTPISTPVKILARPVIDPDQKPGKKVLIEAELFSGDRLTATCRGNFVAVGADHPAVRHGG